MASTADFKNGMTIIYEGILYSIVEFHHVKPGKGGAFVRTKLKNVKTGAVIERTLRSGEKIDVARLESRKIQYQYNTGDFYYFMDSETFEQIPISKDLVTNQILYMKENEIVTILMYGENIIGIELPFFVELKVSDTDPGFKGDTATGGSKPATMETGAIVQVPLFINIGDTLKIDTRTGDYIERL